MGTNKSVSLRLKRLEIGLGHAFEREGDADRLPFSQASVLSYLNERRGSTTSIGQIEQQFNIANPTASGLVKRLLVKGYVSVEAAADDLRRRNVIITKEGRKAVQEADELMARVDERLLAGFDSVECAQLWHLIDKLEKNMGE